MQDQSHMGQKTLGYLGPKIWSLVPEDIKKANNLKEFKMAALVASAKITFLIINTK